MATKKKRKVLRILLIVVIILIVFRICLSFIVLHYANKTLASMDGYYGHIDDLSIALYRGAYTIHDIYIDKISKKTFEQTKFFSSKDIDLSVEWSALFHGSFVGELEFENPNLYFTKDKAEITEVQKDTNDFRKLLKDLMPLRVNRFEVRHGSISYIDPTSNPKVNVKLNDTYILAKNLTNAENTKTELPSTVNANADVYGGEMEFNMKLNALAEYPTFDINAEIKHTNLVLLNDFLKAYGNFDVNRGEFGLYTEMAAGYGKFKGYVKPIIKNLDVVGPEDRKNSVFQKTWEVIVGAVAFTFKNQPEDQLATKVNMEGNFKDPKTKVLQAIWEVLLNAFIQALVPSIDNQINIQSAKSLDGKKEDKPKSKLEKIKDYNNSSNKKDNK
jgi:hypothetical protein